MKYRFLYFLLSLVVIIPGIFALVTWGLKPGIDFTGGSLMEISIATKKAVTISDLEKLVTKEGISVAVVQKTGIDSFIIRTKTIDRVQKDKVYSSIEKIFGKVTELRFETVGPILGKELITKTFWGIFIAAGFILLYVGYQFKEKMFGICAILAMFHDSLVLLGMFAIFGHFFGVEVDTLFVTAVLTILSFSVHDTVVVYDRIRESQKYYPRADFEQLVDKGVNETLTRSLNNSLTIIFMLVALFLLGGETTKWFVVALLIGTISGTYSSTFTAAPLLVTWYKMRDRK